MAEHTEGNEGAEQERGLSDEEFISLISAETQQKLQHKIHGFLGDSQETEDALQDTLIRAWRARDTFRGDSEPETWLYAIAINVAKSARDKKYGRKILQMPILDDGEMSELAVSEEDVEQQVVETLHGNELFGRLKKKIDDLPPKLRAAMVLAAAGLAYKVIANELQISEAAVKVRVHRARKRLERSYDTK